MRALRLMVVTAGLFPLGLLSVMLLHNGWEAVFAALTVLDVSLLAAAVLVAGVEGDRPHPHGPGAHAV